MGVLLCKGNEVGKLCDLCSITVNRNDVFGDSSALAPRGVRVGAPPMTFGGLLEKEFEQIGEYLHQTVQLTLKIQNKHGKLLKDFNKELVNHKEIKDLMSEMKYKELEKIGQLAAASISVRGVLFGNSHPAPSRFSFLLLFIL
ncbi:hypothetical protein MKX03_005722 [Papaver bracteatum]|nr:hypothetical protein MKX03_005722 [Papaver bracteatum]